jgi:hypothetical protein
VKTFGTWKNKGAKKSSYFMLNLLVHIITPRHLKIVLSSNFDSAFAKRTLALCFGLTLWEKRLILPADCQLEKSLTIKVLHTRTEGQIHKYKLDKFTTTVTLLRTARKKKKIDAKMLKSTFW